MTLEVLWYQYETMRLFILYLKFCNEFLLTMVLLIDIFAVRFL